MSSLHQDHLLVEGPEPVTGTRAPRATARGTSRRPAEEKATSTVPTQRQGKSQRSGSTPVTPAVPPRAAGRKAAATAAGHLAARAKVAATTKASATTKAATAKAATAKAVTVKTATAKAATARAATAKAATAARAAAASKVAARTARTAAAQSAPSAESVAAKAPAAAVKAAPVTKPAAAKVTPAPKATPKPAAAPKPAAVAPEPAAAQPIAAPKPRAEATPAKAAVRPTPYKRTPAVAEAAAAAPVASEGTATEVLATEVVAAVAEGRRGRLFGIRPPSIRRRPALYLAAALVGAIGVSGLSGVDPMAQATDTMSHSVSVAQELGIPAAPSAKITDTHATERLGVLAATRKERGAEQAAAAQTQAAANQSVVEAARPQAVLPVNGGRLTSTFGMRWGTLHAGIDLAAPMRTPEMAAMDGVVLKAGPASGFGLAVYIQHANGDVTVYGHMDQILVTEGQVVKAGDVIALLGARGQATGPHLHFEVHVGGIQGEKIDPLPWLRARGVAI